MNANEYNPTHWHSGHISGVLYTKIHNSPGEDLSIKQRNNDGAINLIHGSHQFLSPSLYTYQPKVGDIIVFPHYLMHQVNPFRGDQIRRSIAFNCYIDEGIFDVYEKQIS